MIPIDVADVWKKKAINYDIEPIMELHPMEWGIRTRDLYTIRKMSDVDMHAFSQ